MASSDTKPTILLVSGAFQTSSCYDKLVPYLQEAGYLTELATIPSLNAKDPNTHTASSDGQYLLKHHLLPLLEDGKDVVVFAHSFGATTLSGAEAKLTKDQRSVTGQKGGVLGIVYISFALVPNSDSQVNYLGGQWPPFCKLNHPSSGLFVFDPVIETLFNDAQHEEQARLAETHLPHALRPFETPVATPLWTESALKGKRVYLKTLQDNVFPATAQQMFVDGCGVDWDILEIDAGHEAFLTQPETVAYGIVAAAQRFSRNSSSL